MEVFLLTSTAGFLTSSLLHVRGGVSTSASVRSACSASSPRPWRCFSIADLATAPVDVFSTSVEVFPGAFAVMLPGPGLLHVRGGVSRWLAVLRVDIPSSPRPWRCFLRYSRIAQAVAVFSTSVEVFPIARVVSLRSGCLLHVRGGVSYRRTISINASRSSPRPWRCFQARCPYPLCQYVFSTSVEVFPRRAPARCLARGLLHVRGGVSLRAFSGSSKGQSSPRPWRCFRLCLLQ